MKFRVGPFLSYPLCENCGRMKNIKQQFITAVRILAPENDFILKLALRIPEEQLPAYPGGAALEFVAALEKLGSSPAPCAQSPWLRPVSPPARRRCPGGRCLARTRLTGRRLGRGFVAQLLNPTVH